MKHSFTMRAVGLLSACLIAAGLPAMQDALYSKAMTAAAGDAVLSRAVSYTDSSSMTVMFQSIMSGDCGLYLDTNGTKPSESLAVGSSMSTTTIYYARTDSGVYSPYGRQCYIYAQGVYARLFDEIVYHGSESKTYAHSTQVMGASPVLTASMMQDAQVMPGAYVRTTCNADGSYDGSNGHSMIVLGYDDTTISLLEGNADGNGLIRQISMTYERFTEIYLTNRSRYIAHVIQPIDSYYQSVYGISADDYYGAAEIPPAEPEVIEPIDWETESVEIHRTERAYQLSVPVSAELIWTSSDPEIAEVDAEGWVTPKQDGQVTITASDGSQSYDFALEIAALAWDAVGDVDGDGKVSLFDAMATLHESTAIMVEAESLLTPEQAIYADVDDNGRITAVDAQLILQYYVAHSLTESDGDPATLWNQLLP